MCFSDIRRDQFLAYLLWAFSSKQISNLLGKNSFNWLGLLLYLRRVTKGSFHNFCSKQDMKPNKGENNGGSRDMEGGPSSISEEVGE